MYYGRMDRTRAYIIAMCKWRTFPELIKINDTQSYILWYACPGSREIGTQSTSPLLRPRFDKRSVICIVVWII
jgi:hypothetical protein